MKMLIVEDDRTSSLVLQHYLNSLGEVFTAENGLQAVEIFKEALEKGLYFDLICMDVMMPEMDGHAALDLIRAMEEKKSLPQKKRVKVIMTTALGDCENVMKAAKSHCSAYLLKPIKRQALMEKLHSIGLC